MINCIKREQIYYIYNYFIYVNFRFYLRVNLYTHSVPFFTYFGAGINQLSIGGIRYCRQHEHSRMQPCFSGPQSTRHSSRGSCGPDGSMLGRGIGKKEKKKKGGFLPRPSRPGCRIPLTITQWEGETWQLRGARFTGPALMSCYFCTAGRVAKIEQLFIVGS